MIEACDESTSQAARERVLLDDEEFERPPKWSSLVARPGSQPARGHRPRVGPRLGELKVDPATVIKEYYSALEEARADLVALWFMGDPKLVELGLVLEKDLAKIEHTAYEIYTRNALTQLRRVRRATRSKRPTCGTAS